MARSKSSSGYPDTLNGLVVAVGKNHNEVQLHAGKIGMQINSLRTTLQCFFAAVKREGLEPNADKYMKERGAYAEKIIVRAQGEFVVVSHRDSDRLGLAVEAAIAEAVKGSVACHDGPTPPGGADIEKGKGQMVGTEEEIAISRVAMGRVAPASPTVLGVRDTASEAMLAEVAALGTPPGIYSAQVARVSPEGEVTALQGVQERPPANSSKLLPMQSAPGSMLEMVAGESEQSAPRPAVEKKYKRADGKPYPEEADGEPTWGFNADGEPKINQFF